jgi:hypothetical protein
MPDIFWGKVSTGDISALRGDISALRGIPLLPLCYADCVGCPESGDCDEEDELEGCTDEST